jgi:zinc/manganese transport system substrate-binding protein
MNTIKLVLLFVLALTGLVFDLSADSKLKVVTSLNTFASIASQIGADRLELRAIAKPAFNPHFIEPRPSDVLSLKRAQLFIHGGLDLEAWREPLVQAAANMNIRPAEQGELDLSKGISLLQIPDRVLTRADGDLHLYGNPHYWMDPRNGLIIAQSIESKLSQIDPNNSDLYKKNLDIFSAMLRSKILEWQSLMSFARGREVVAYHNEWIYLTSFAGLKIEHYLEPKPGIPPTPKQLEFLIDYIKGNSITAVIQASYYPKQAGQYLERETGAKLLLLCQSVAERKECSDYISMLDYNIKQLNAALSPQSSVLN